ncbi:fimbrillin family protein [uncultured Bacteroides sp.]|jgi:hypothetical protein|uniref:fimbrillin family protein n=1 Tax=uncultured Bacteroides sp. TaxID=162156 RepID=UPI00280B0511|nr:fimbrillin family protein [uncultured Bacteroides sp.]
MKSFTAIIFWSILLVCSACTDDNDTDTGKGTDYPDGMPLTVRATTTGFETPSGSGQPSTRASAADKHLHPEFADNDKIGIFAVKDGAILNDIDNIPLVYKAADNSWNPVEGGKTLYWYSGVNYITYYPYKENIAIDPSLSTDEIVASLTKNDKLQPAKDQSAMKEYAASDLMIATGTPDTSNPSQVVLNLQFKHQFTLLVVHPQTYIGCYAPKDAGFVYHQESRILDTDSLAGSVSLNGVTPYQVDSMRYCAIVLPQENAKISGNYTTTHGVSNEQKKINYSGSSTAFASGKCYTLKVISPIPGKGSTERKLYPGDFVFQNETDKRIEVHPGNSSLDENGKIYDYQNAIGMVITCSPDRMTDSECNAEGWNHAYVMGLENVGVALWGVSNQIVEDIPAMTQYDKIEDNMNGFSETRQLLLGKAGLAANYVSTVIANQRKKETVPEGIKRSPWFLPSIGQWFDMLDNIGGRSPRDFGANTAFGLNDLNWGQETLDKLTEQLSKVGSSLPAFKDDFRLGFSCSSQYNETRSWMILWHIGDPDYPTWNRICLQGFSKSSGWNVRLFFAF